ncbi:hypothetical protein KB559_15855 [Paenibacillus sp. Marseille-P2973]|nr:hypothetical protein [Paenibacillus sp. Marseille-P2973]
MWTCTLADDLSIEQVNEDANVVPAVLDLHIRQIANDEALSSSLVKPRSNTFVITASLQAVLWGLNWAMV